MFNANISDCISRWQVEFITVCFLFFGQYLIRKYYSQKGKYSLNENQEDAKLNQSKNTLESYQIQLKSLKSLIKNGQIDQAEKYFGNMMQPCILAYTIMMKGFTKQGSFKQAQNLLNTMHNEDQKPNVVTYNTFLTCALKAKEFKIAEETFNKIQDKDIISYSTYILGLLKNKKLKESMKIHQEANLNQKIDLDQMYFNVLINGLLKNNEIQQAYIVYNQMVLKRFPYSQYSVSVPFQLFNKSNNQQIDQILESYEQFESQYLYSQVILQFFKSDTYIHKGCEIMNIFIQKEIVLRKEVCQKAIETLYKVCSKQIVKNNLTVEFAQQQLQICIDYVTKHGIPVSNKFMQECVQKSCNKILLTQKLNSKNIYRNQEF